MNISEGYTIGIQMPVIAAFAAIFLLLIISLYITIGKLGFYAKALDKSEMLNDKKAGTIKALLDDTQELKAVAEEHILGHYEQQARALKLTDDVKYWKTQCNKFRGQLGLDKLERA